MPSPRASGSATVSQITRRQFVCFSALATGALALPGCAAYSRARSNSPNEKLNVAVIGAGGKGASDTDSVAELGENIVGLCDADDDTLGKRCEKYPLAKRYRD